MAYRYYEGNGCDKNLVKAIEWWENAANNGDKWSQNRLGFMYLNGIGVEQDYKKARKWYEKASELFIPVDTETDPFIASLFEQDNGLSCAYDKSQWANLELGLMFFNGKGVIKDYSLAKQYLEKAAAVNEDDWNIYAVCFSLRYDSEKTKEDEWFNQACEYGFAMAQYNLGLLYHNGFGVDRDIVKAYQYYKKAADKEYEQAVTALKGIVKELEEVANQGNLYALLFLGDLYRKGTYINKDLSKAFTNYEKAANKNHYYAQCIIGYMYEDGLGIKKDLEKAFLWYEKSAKQDYAPAQHYIALMYYYGDGIEKNYSKAYEWCKKAAEQNYPYSLGFLGDMFYYGNGTEKDLKKAFEYYEKAASEDITKAQTSLADMYYDGEGIEKNYKKAFEYYKKAAKKDDAYAQYSLGFMFEHGQGVEKNINKAKEWYEKAAKQNYESAVKALNEMKNKN